MLNRLIDYAALLLISSGGITLIGGIAGGATELLSGDTPLTLAAAGISALYLALTLLGLRALWYMDVKGGRQ